MKNGDVNDPYHVAMEHQYNTSLPYSWDVGGIANKNIILRLCSIFFFALKNGEQKNQS